MKLFGMLFIRNKHHDTEKVQKEISALIFFPELLYVYIDIPTTVFSIYLKPNYFVLCITAENMSVCGIIATCTIEKGSLHQYLCLHLVNDHCVSV